MPLRQHDDVVVEMIRNGAAVLQGGQAGRRPGPQPSVHGIEKQPGRAPAPARAVAFRKHSHHGLEVPGCQFAIRPGVPKTVKKFVGPPFAGADLRHHLLGENVQRRPGNADHVQFASLHGSYQRHTFDQVIAAEGEQAPARHGANLVAGTADPLQKSRHAARGTKLAYQVHVPDVDTKLQRGGGDQRLEPPGLQGLLRFQAVLAGQAAMVGGYEMLANALGQVPGQPLREPPGIDEDQRGGMRLHQGLEAVVNFFPDLVGHDRCQRRGSQLEAYVAFTLMAGIDDSAVTPSGQEAADLADRLLGGGKAYAGVPPGVQGVQPGQGQGQMAAPLVAGQSMDLVDNDRLRAQQHVPSGIRSQQQVQRFRRGDQDVGRIASPFSGVHRASCRRCEPWRVCRWARHRTLQAALLCPPAGPADSARCHWKEP